VKARGMDVTFVTSAATDDEAKFLLRELGLPLRKAETTDIVLTITDNKPLTHDV
jgi:hypothetical protein